MARPIASSVLAAAARLARGEGSIASDRRSRYRAGQSGCGGVAKRLVIGNLANYRAVLRPSVPIRPSRRSARTSARPWRPRFVRTWRRRPDGRRRGGRRQAIGLSGAQTARYSSLSPSSIRIVPTRSGRNCRADRGGSAIRTRSRGRHRALGVNRAAAAAEAVGAQRAGRLVEMRDLERRAAHRAGPAGFSRRRGHRSPLALRPA